jgi:hypothetical protein
VQHQASATSSAGPDVLWSVVTDVERWPDLIDVYEQVRRTRSGPLELGEEVHVKQRGLAAGSWTVTTYDEGRAFVWEQRSRGVLVVGGHTVEPAGDGSRLTLTLDMSGGMAGLLSAVLGRRVRRYVDLECERLTAEASQRE